MGLADFFRGVNQGAEQQYNLENRSRKLAHQDLTLAALQQQYADEMTLKPLELAQNQSAYGYNTAKNLFDTNKVRFDNDNFIRNRDALIANAINTANTDAAKSQYALSQAKFDNDNFIRNQPKLAQVFDNNVQNNVSTSGYQALKSGIDYDVATKNKGTLTGIQENAVKAGGLQAEQTINDYAINDKAQSIYADMVQNGYGVIKGYLNSADPVEQAAAIKILQPRNKKETAPNGAVMTAQQKQAADQEYANGLYVFPQRFIPTNEDGVLLDKQTMQKVSISQAANIAANGNGEAAGRILKGFSENSAYFAPTTPREQSALAAIVAEANGWAFKNGAYYDSQGKQIDPATGQAAEEKVKGSIGKYFE